jgi:hypothetical protein
MYLQNKYTKWYNNIILNAKSRISPNEYSERHHIIPKSLGGNNSSENLVCLTAREHYISHLLLTKMVLGKQKKSMVFALWHLRNRHNLHNLSTHNSRVYAALKVEFSKLSSELHKNKKISDEHKSIISRANKNKKVTNETKTKISNSKLGKKRKPFTEEHKSNMNKFGYGSNNPNFGGNFTEEHKFKLSIAAKNHLKYKCTCGKECSPSNFKRWHGENCKSNVH